VDVKEYRGGGGKRKTLLREKSAKGNLVFQEKKIHLERQGEGPGEESRGWQKKNHFPENKKTQETRIKFPSMEGTSGLGGVNPPKEGAQRGGEERGVK